MTQPLDVAYVEIKPDVKDFSRDVKKELDKAYTSIEKDTEKANERVRGSFKDTQKRIGGLFGDVNKTITGAFTKLSESGVAALAGLGEAGVAAAGNVTKLGQGLSGIVAFLGEIAATGPVGIIAVAAAVATLGAALAAAAAVAAALVQNIITVGSFAAAVLPGVVAGLAAGFGILKLAFSGVAEAFEEQTEAGTKAAGAAVNNARQIADAQRGVLQAQKDLIKAREEERERIQDVNRELLAARTSEKRATDNVLKAEFELQQARKFGTPRQVIEAQLALEEANATLAEQKDRTEDLAAEKKKADKVGVEGSDRVLAAQEALRDAQDRLAESMRQVSAGAAGVGRQASAFDSLTKSAQAFVLALRSAKEQLTPIQKAIQEAFFSGTAPLIQPIVDNIKALQPELVRVAAGFGDIFKEVLKFLGSDEAKDAVGSILDGLADFLTEIKPAIVPLLNAFAGLAGESGQFGKTLGGVVAEALLKIADFVSKVDLVQLFEDAKEAVAELWPVVKSLTSITIDLFQVFAAAGQVVLPPLADALSLASEGFQFFADKITTVFENADKFFKLLKKDPAEAFRLVGEGIKKFIEDAAKGFDNFLVGISETIDKAKNFIKDLPENIKKLGPKMLEAGKTLVTKLFEGLGAASGFLADIGRQLANSVIKFINRSIVGNLNSAIDGVQKALNKLPLFDVDLPNIPNIPQLEKGGLAVGHTLAEIGERGRREAVLPLEDPRAMSAVGKAISSAGGVGGGVTFGDIHIHFDGAVPTAAEAFRTGQSLSEGIKSAMARREIRTQLRII